MTFYGIEVRPDGRYQVYMTEDGIRRTPVPRPAFGKPRDAVRFADMRQQAISPLRVSVEASVPVTDVSAEPLTRLHRRSGR